MLIKGIGVSSGVVIGKVYIKKEIDMAIKRSADDPLEELNKLKKGIDECDKKLDKLYSTAFEQIGEEEAEIFQAHKLLLKDPEISSQVKDKIDKGFSAEWAIDEVMNVYVDMFNAMEDEYLKERASDIKDVFSRLIRALKGIKEDDFSDFNEKVIVVGKDLTPSDTAQMDKSKVIGFITELGGKTSHSAIMARTLSIPAIVGATDIIHQLEDGDQVVFDGEEGTIIIHPSEEEIRMYDDRKKQNLTFMKELETLKGLKSETKDGHVVSLLANVGTLSDLDYLTNSDAEGIGLFRTEFLYMDRGQLPTEEEQFNVYREAVYKVDGKTVIIRTLDIGGDKELSYLNFKQEMNPFLGYRAIRICLERKDIFKVQLRAILRASAYGDIKIMFPMISSLEELYEAKAILEQVKIELQKENIGFNKHIDVGMMVEVPTVAILSDMFAKEVDFFSIGTNDLVQYMTAVDRGNEQVAHLYHPYHPAVLRVMKLVIENAHKEGIWVGMCGEAASDPLLIPVLVGMGIDELSMVPTAILKAKHAIRKLSYKKIKALKDEIGLMSTTKEVQYLIDTYLEL